MKRHKYISHIDHKFNSRNDPIAKRVERSYYTMEDDINTQFTELDNNFPALFGKLSMKDPYPVSKISSAFNIGNQHEGFQLNCYFLFFK
jgi:hypothetical protein